MNIHNLFVQNTLPGVKYISLKIEKNYQSQHFKNGIMKSDFSHILLNVNSLDILKTIENPHNIFKYIYISN